MAFQVLQVGCLFSSTGSYELAARSMLNHAVSAAEKINAAAPDLRFPVDIDDREVARRHLAV
jgi:hypothetical protein